MLIFWNLPRRLRPKIWPKEGQKFSKSKKFKLGKIRKIMAKSTLFAKTNKKLLRLLIFCFFCLRWPSKKLLHLILILGFLTIINTKVFSISYKNGMWNGIFQLSLAYLWQMCKLNIPATREIIEKGIFICEFML